MHVITGGAYNGKAAWVREYYQIEQQKICHWYNAHEDDPLPNRLENDKEIIVLEGMEQWVFQWMQEMDLDEVRKYGRHLIEQWLAWEQQAKQNRIIVICTDISKGIVPMDTNMRKWRDLTGWFYQDLVENSDRVHLIWYSIAKQLK